MVSAISQASVAPLPPAAEEPLRLPVGQRPCAPEHAPHWRYRPEIGQVVRSVCPETDWEQSVSGQQRAS